MSRSQQIRRTLHLWRINTPSQIEIVLMLSSYLFSPVASRNAWPQFSILRAKRCKEPFKLWTGALKTFVIRKALPFFKKDDSERILLHWSFQKSTIVVESQSLQAPRITSLQTLPLKLRSLVGIVWGAPWQVEEFRHWTLFKICVIYCGCFCGPLWRKLHYRSIPWLIEKMSKIACLPFQKGSHTRRRDQLKRRRVCWKGVQYPFRSWSEKAKNPEKPFK